MSRDLGTIRIELTPEGLDAAIKQVKQVQKDLKDALNNTVQELAVLGENAAKTWLYTGPQASDEPDYGEVEASITHRAGDRKGVAYVYSKSDKAAFLEYGTGLVGSILPHPGLKTGESTPPVLTHKVKSGAIHMYTAYDTYGHGEAGWFFPKKDGSGYANTVALRDMEKMAPAVFDAELAKLNIRRWGG